MAKYEILGKPVDGLPDDAEAVERAVTLDFVAKIAQEHYPTLWKRVYTKHVEPPPGYASNKALSVAFLAGMVADQRHPSMSQPAMVAHRVNDNRLKIVSNMSVVLTQMELYDFPLYYVSRNIVDAMAHTHPPDSMCWSDVMFPFPAVAFMLPAGMIQEEVTGLSVSLIGAARIPKTHPVYTKNADEHAVLDPVTEDRVCVFWALGRSCTTTHTCVFPISQLLEPSPEWIDEKTRVWSELIHREYDGPSGQFSSLMAGLVSNFLLLMQARRQMVEPGPRTNRRLKSGVRVHAPTWIGRNYQVLRDLAQKQTPTGAHFTELGWRAGHYRRQHYGPKGTEVKLILIDPYVAYVRGLVQAEEEKKV